jgi:hypothetical protein
MRAGEGMAGACMPCGWAWACRGVALAVRRMRHVWWALYVASSSPLVVLAISKC